MVKSDQKDWLKRTPLVEFALNLSINNLSGFAPFELNYGYMPWLISFPTKNIKYHGVKEFTESSR